MTTSVDRADRFGLTWHPTIAAAVVAHLDRIDVIEVIPEGRFLESRQARRALRRLARSVPVSIHGVSLGFGSVVTTDCRRLESFARLVGEVEPESWSEHLAFVRAGGIELGHLAAPPRTALTVEAVGENVERARRAIGAYPALENVATPLEPPGSDRSEAAWLQDVFDTSSADLLLDLHNLHTNAVNFGYKPTDVLDAVPAHRIRGIHIAGGVEVRTHGGDTRRIDDHLHDVPEAVFQLLEMVGERVPQPIDVVLERDGAFPTFDALLAQLDAARAALARGRSRAAGRHDVDHRSMTHLRADRTLLGSDHDGAQLEQFLARLYTDRNLRACFLRAPIAEAQSAGFSHERARQLARIDQVGLELAAVTFARKRRGRDSSGETPLWRRLAGMLTGHSAG